MITLGRKGEWPREKGEDTGDGGWGKGDRENSEEWGLENRVYGLHSVEGWGGHLFL